jgi:hypothetical protein
VGVGSAHFSILLTGVPLWCSPLPVGTSLLRVPSAAPDFPSGAALYFAVELSEDRRLYLSGSLVAPDERGVVLYTLWSACCRARCPCAQGAALGNEPLPQRPLAARFPNRLVVWW